MNFNQTPNTQNPSEPTPSEPTPPTPPVAPEEVEPFITEPPSETPPSAPPPATPVPPSQPQQFAPASGSKIGLIVFLILFLLIIIPSGLIFATENGYLDLGLDKYYNQIGLEKLWNGLPLDGKLAMIKVDANMKNQKSFHFNTNADLNYALGQISVPFAALTGVLQNSAAQVGKVLGEEASTQNITFNLMGDYDKSGIFSTKLVLKVPKEMGQVYGLALTGDELSFDILGDGANYFVKIPPELSTLPSAGKYIKFESSQVNTSLSKWQTATLQDKLEKAIKSSERLKNENIEGVSSYHYRFVLDKNKLTEIDSSLTSETISDNPKVDVFISKKKHLINKISTKLTISGQEIATGTSGEIQFNLIMSDYNKTVTVTKPLDEEIAEGGLENLIGGGTGLPAEQPQVTPDAQRKTDLAKIKDALTKYYNDKNKYPVAAEIDHTNNKQGVLYKALVPTYFSVLPVDPKDPTWWYGYQSDGTTYKLWSLLENKSDSEGTLDGQYYKYIITNE